MGQTNSQRISCAQAPRAPLVGPGNRGHGTSPSHAVLSGVDGAGDVTAAYNSVAPITPVANWSRRRRADASRALAVPGSVTVQDLAVNAGGRRRLLRPRAGPTSGSATGTASAARPQLARSPDSTCDDYHGRHQRGGHGRRHLPGRRPVWAATRTATTIGRPRDRQQAVTTRRGADTRSHGRRSTAAGNAYAAFTSATAPASFVRTALRPPGGGWQESGDLSTTQPLLGRAGADRRQPRRRGAARLEAAAPACQRSIQARSARRATGIWGPVETVNDAGADVPVAAICDDGSGVAPGSARRTGGNIGQARIREPGAGGVWGDIHNLNALHTRTTRSRRSRPTAQRLRHVSAPYDGTGQAAAVSAYDVAPPTVSRLRVTGTLLAGDPLVLGVNATDEWSAVGTPAWTFGDGGTGTGLTPAHIYTTAGTYTAHVTVTDGSGNSSARTSPSSCRSRSPRSRATKFTAKWKQQQHQRHARRDGHSAARRQLRHRRHEGQDVAQPPLAKLPAGAFTHTFKLTAKFLPGHLQRRARPGVPATQITAAAGRPRSTRRPRASSTSPS